VHGPALRELDTVDVLEAFNHLVNLLLPGLATGILAAALTKLLWRRDLAGVPFLRLAGIAAGVSACIGVAGLVAFGRDGRMLTYLFMVLGCALALAVGGWAGRRGP
jgi:hypothetical protein